VERVLPWSEWSDPARFRVVTEVALMPSTIIIDVPTTWADSSPEMVVLTIRSWPPGRVPSAEDATESQAFAIDIETARLLARALSRATDPA
jgi:hypothetical protein